jgi:hypothetical protein
VTTDSPPQARRLPAPRWFDLRFLLGIVIVVVPIVIGAHLLASADRYVSVYVARRALVPGQHLIATDVAVGRVRFDGQGGHYVAAKRPPVDYLVTRYVAAGELVPIAALTGTPAALTAQRLVTVPVATGHAPLDLVRGDVVDIYATTKSTPRDKVARPRLVIGAAPVDSVSRSGALSSSGAVSLVIEVPAVGVDDVVRAIEAGALDVVRVPGNAVATVSSPQPKPVATGTATP